MIKISSRWLIPVLVIASAFAGILYSHHGLLELRAFQKIIVRTQVAIAKVEDENKKLRRQLDLLDDPSAAITERQVREIMGWVRPSEIVFHEIRHEVRR